MGLFASEDGHIRGWLAALLCCCAAVNDDELVKKQDSKDSMRSAASYQQPLPMKPLGDYSTNAVKPFDNGDESSDTSVPRTQTSTKTAENPPSLKPLKLGDSSLLERRAQLGARKTSATKVNRLSIGAPSAFRKLDHADGQRQGLVPLRLGPVVLKDASVSDETVPTHERSDSMQELLFSAQTTAGRANQTVSAPATRTSGDHPSSNIEEREESSKFAANLPPSVSAQYLSGVPSRQESGAGTSPVSHKSSSDRERSRLKRNRSTQSNRKLSSDIENSAIEQEILELNTIVEERRAEAARGARDVRHVPAIAPSMQVGARSETLNAIGSALSRPLTAPESVSTKVDARSSDIDLPLQRPTESLRRSSSRVSGWLSGMFASASAPHLPPDSGPFYKCRPTQPPMPDVRRHSATSLCSFVTDSDSPSLTAGSSPTTKGHSSTITAESHLTPITPPGMNGSKYPPEPDRSKPGCEGWSATARVPVTQVGLAM